MSNQDNNSINNFDFNLICEYFASVERQGPGSAEATHKALEFISKLNKDNVVADIGCGSGSSALQIASKTQAKVIAVDLFPLFLEKVKAKAAKLKLTDRVATQQADMTNLNFDNDSFDVIWSEGAIYNIGFERGLNEWKRFIKTGGYIAVTDATWITDSRPAEIELFWTDAYPQIDTLSANIAKMVAAGYVPIATFVLPDECWTKNFYKPQQLAQEVFLKQHQNDFTANELVRNQRHEAELYAKYHSYYGYVFYIGRKL